MSKIKSFTLIELIIVIILIGVISFLVVKIPSYNSKIIKIDNLRKELSPNGYIIFDNEKQKIKISKKLNLYIYNPEIFLYKENSFEKQEKFKYIVKNGIQNSFILKSDKGIFIFKPLKTIKVNSIEKAKNIYFLNNFQPKEGTYF